MDLGRQLRWVSVAIWPLFDEFGFRSGFVLSGLTATCLLGEPGVPDNWVGEGWGEGGTQALYGLVCMNYILQHLSSIIATSPPIG